MTIKIHDILKKKRNGEALTDDEIIHFVKNLNPTSPHDEEIHESQIGSFLMAAWIKGLNCQETSVLTESMTKSGYTFQWPQEWKGRIVDKHSTGGVGDKVSLVLTPALAACGLIVPMISGRGLDHTGGTLDKLESIPGFNVEIPPQEMKRILQDVGCCIVGQTENIVPADKKLYAIRDVTATVDSQPLIVASIISKKAAEGLDALVLDVKTGCGAVLKSFNESRRLAEEMVDVGNNCGMKTTALITNMDKPLGNAVGNALEVAEAIETLRGKGPEDLMQLVLALGGQLLCSVGKCETPNAGEDMILYQIKSGKALETFHKMILKQGVDRETADKVIAEASMWSVLPQAPVQKNILSQSSGIITGVNALEIARVCHSLGCGRKGPKSKIKYEPGVVLKKTVGDRVNKDDVLLTLHCCTEEEAMTMMDQLLKSFQISTRSETCIERPLIFEIIDGREKK